MIEPTLFFALGFLCAGFLALMIAPAVWRRAVNLTRRRIEASVPLTLNEIQADKDRLRAEYAMSTRRLEMSIKSLKEKSAEQVAEIGRARAELKRLAAERDEKHGASSASDARNSELRAQLRQREEELQQIKARLDEAKQALDASERELKRVNGLYEEAQFSASGRQIDLVARESEIEKLTDDISRMKREANAEKLKLKDQIEDLKQQVSALKAGAKDADAEKAAGNANEDRKRLESRLTSVTRENKKLRAELAALERTRSPEDGSSEKRASALLREQISELAAQVVSMTITLEGKDSAAAKAIAKKSSHERPLDADGKVVISLADRVRALQKAAPPR